MGLTCTKNWAQEGHIFCTTLYMIMSIKRFVHDNVNDDDGDNYILKLFNYQT